VTTARKIAPLTPSAACVCSAAGVILFGLARLLHRGRHPTARRRARCHAPPRSGAPRAAAALLPYAAAYVQLPKSIVTAPCGYVQSRSARRLEQSGAPIRSDLRPARAGTTIADCRKRVLRLRFPGRRTVYITRRLARKWLTTGKGTMFYRRRKSPRSSRSGACGVGRPPANRQRCWLFSESSCRVGTSVKITISIGSSPSERRALILTVIRAFHNQMFHPICIQGSSRGWLGTLRSPQDQSCGYGQRHWKALEQFVDTMVAQTVRQESVATSRGPVLEHHTDQETIHDQAIGVESVQSQLLSEMGIAEAILPTGADHLPDGSTAYTDSQ
jgi:hypothetical protein